MRGIITDIQRFSIHDGPGIRTTVFLKGCNLRCAWCHNPETLRSTPDLQSYPERCIGCGACLEACPTGARQRIDGRLVYQRERCTVCGACARECYAEATVLVGREVGVAEVLDEVLRDRPFYEESGGGITLSGGEPLMQYRFAGELLKAARAEGLHTAIETNLASPWRRVASVLPCVDLLMMDLKVADDARHRDWTGVSNRQVLANFRRLAGTGVLVIVRTPVVPGVNDTVDDITAIADIAAALPDLLYYELLPFHPLGTDKYRRLGLPYRLHGLQAPPREQMAALAAAARSRGVRVVLAGEDTRD